MQKKLAEGFLTRTNTFYLKGYQDTFNKRLKIEDFRGNEKEIVQEIQRLTDKLGAHKVIVKCRQEYVGFFMEQGYLPEAFVNGYFLGSDGYFMCKYFDSNRYQSETWCEEDAILQGVWQKSKKNASFLDRTMTLRQAQEKDAEKLANFYSQVFPVYPVPIEDPSYVREQIAGDTMFMIVEENGSMIAAASAEMNHEYKNAEITDCATLSSHRKGGYMNVIIQRLEQELLQHQIYCSYSIARALSFGMNAVLHNLDYTYKGRLKNNCYIFDKIEDMNVWYKDLSKNGAEKSAQEAKN